MLIRSFLLATRQLGDPAFRRALLLSTLVMGALLLVLIPAGMAGGAALMSWFGSWAGTDGGWVATALMGAGMVLGLLVVAGPFLLCFASIATITIGPFLDDVIVAVYARHYPDRTPGETIGWLASLKSGVRLLVLGIVAHGVCLPLHLLGLIFPLLGLGLFWGISAMVVGREFRDLVMLRHSSRSAAGVNGGPGFLGTTGWGLVWTGLFAIPGVNLVAPLLGAAAMVHFVESSRSDDRIVPGA